MQNYENTFVKWMAFFQAKSNVRKKVVDSLHPEVRRGFTAIMRIAIEEIKARVENYSDFENIEEVLKQLLINSVFAGYMLFCIRNSKDPIELKLNENDSTTKIANIWIEKQKKDNCVELMKKIDPFMIMLIEKGKQARMNQITVSYPDIIKLPYKDVFELDRFFIWSSIQGYIFGMLEQNLYQTSEISNEIREGSKKNQSTQINSE
ncbi:hypothetical protein GF362_01285 [Candidatus Dojkabacteria bacterium]|nr:hypothetical protein [Candidatus Dojkabacteria bacterium]